MITLPVNKNLIPKKSDSSRKLSSQGFEPVFYQRYVNDIFILFKSNDHVKYFQDFLNSCHINMSFSMETEKENKLSFLDVEVIRKQGKFTTTVY